MPDRYQALRDAIAAGPTHGPWKLETVQTNGGQGICHKIGAFPASSHYRSENYACVYADGIRMGIDESLPIAQELLANAQLMAAADPDTIRALLHERDALREALQEVVRVQESGVEVCEWAASMIKAHDALDCATGGES